MNIKIDPLLKELTPDFEIGVITGEVTVHDSNIIADLISLTEESTTSTTDITDCIHLPRIKEARDAYKTYGKDPSRYRLAVESLYRRLSKGNTLYRINSLVDLGNILSIETKQSIAVLDLDKIQGDVLVRLGRDEDVYHGIGRGSLNISKIPLYEDDLGPFGSTTSDTERTMITNQTKNVLLFVISFTGKDHLVSDLARAEELLKKYASGMNLHSYIVT